MNYKRVCVRAPANADHDQRSMYVPHHPPGVALHIRTIDRRGGRRLNSLAGHATERDDMPYPADGMQHARARSGRITRALSLMSTATVDGGLECHIQKI